MKFPWVRFFEFPMKTFFLYRDSLQKNCLIVTRTAFYFAFLFFLGSGILRAEDAPGMTVFGNRETPKVLFIVPWKPAELPDLKQGEIDPAIQEALRPMDRETLRRQLYFDRLLLSPQKNIN